MSEMQFRFRHKGRFVTPGQLMHVAPEFWWRAGRSGRVERYREDRVVLRSENGAVPTVPLHALLWEPHPKTTALAELRSAGFTHPTDRDVDVWITARALGPNAK